MPVYLCVSVICICILIAMFYSRRSAKTPYAKSNGGLYNFIVEKEIAIPQDLV